MNINLRWLKYRVADLLFNNELDEAFDSGKMHGIEYASRLISSRLNAPRLKESLTKTQLSGFDIAYSQVQSCKYDIHVNTGADVYEVY
jgi:hypothetical protein